MTKRQIKNQNGTGVGTGEDTQNKECVDVRESEGRRRR